MIYIEGYNYGVKTAGLVRAMGHALPLMGAVAAGQLLPNTPGKDIDDMTLSNVTPEVNVKRKINLKRAAPKGSKPTMIQNAQKWVRDHRYKVDIQANPALDNRLDALKARFGNSQTATGRIINAGVNMARKFTPKGIAAAYARPGL